MEDAKKRGRPAAAKTSDGNESGGEVVPKKRGRPSKPQKVKKPPSGRGRGRPKNSPAKVSDGEDGAVNGAGESVSAASGGGSGVGRGRPPKKGKASQPIEATRKGPVRAKNAPKSDQDDKDEEEEDEEEEDGDDDDEDDSTVKGGGGSGGKPQKLAGKRAGNAKAPKKVGRPRKPVDSDLDEESDDDKQQQEKKILGRPPTGAINLNIVATGRGKGRPKKDANGVLIPKPGRKRGYKVKVPTGSPRGRPSATTKSSDSANSQDDEDSQSDEEDQTLPLIGKGKKPDADNSVVFNGSEEEDDDDQQEDDDSVDLPAAKLTTAA